MKRAFLSLVALTLFAVVVAAQEQPGFSGRPRSTRSSRRGTRESPGCALGIYKDGAIVYERGYGMADLEHDVPIAPDTPFYISSVSKQFTASAAALAIQQGKVGADDAIRKYFQSCRPRLANYGAAARAPHQRPARLLHAALGIAGRRQDELYDNLAVLRLAVRQKDLNFAPGSDYLYSNTGYALLALLVRRATGSSFGASLTRTSSRRSA